MHHDDYRLLPRVVPYVPRSSVRIILRAFDREVGGKEGSERRTDLGGVRVRANRESIRRTRGNFRRINPPGLHENSNAID